MNTYIMKKQVMSVEIFNKTVFATTDGMVSLTGLCTAGNHWRGEAKMKPYQLPGFMSSGYLKEYIKAASIEWGIDESKFLKVVGRGQHAQTYGHVSIAVLLAEKISPAFHARVHHIFIDGQILQNRLMGGDEFKRVNLAIDEFLPSPSGNNSHRYINVSKWIREKCEINKPCESEIETWNQEAANSTTQLKRVKMLEFIAGMIEIGAVKSWDELKSVIEKL